MKLISLLLFGLAEVVFSIPVVSNEEYHNPLKEKEDKYVFSVVKKRQVSRESYSDIIVFPDSIDNEGNTILSKPGNQRRPVPRPVQNIGGDRPQYPGGFNGNGSGGRQPVSPSGNGRIPVFEEPDGGFVLFNGSSTSMGGNTGLSGSRRPVPRQPGRNFDGNGRPSTAGQAIAGFDGIPNAGGPLGGQKFDGNSRPVQGQPGFNSGGRYPQGSNGRQDGRIPNDGSDIPKITTYAAFSGDGCASGLLKFGEQCIYIDK